MPAVCTVLQAQLRDAWGHPPAMVYDIPSAKEASGAAGLDAEADSSSLEPGPAAAIQAAAWGGQGATSGHAGMSPLSHAVHAVHTKSGQQVPNSPPNSGFLYRPPQTPSLQHSASGLSVSSQSGHIVQGAPGSDTPKTRGSFAQGPMGQSSGVPLDPFTSLKMQYDGLVAFMLRVQNLLDGWAGSLERLVALATWQDPAATAGWCLDMS